jgi:hypothetical protein
MALAGRRIWYHPQWFDDHVPNLDIEGDQLERLNVSETVDHTPSLAGRT